MKMEMSLNQTLKQNLSLKQQYSLKVLSMGTEDLHHFLEQAVLENPLFETKDSFYDIRNTMNTKYDQMMNYIVVKPTLREDLELQLHTLRESINEDLAMLLIDSLDDRGYLSLSNDELCNLIGVDEDTLEDTIALLQTFEPYGVFARNLQECLLIQLSYEKNPYQKLALKLVDEYLIQLGGNLDELCKSLGITRDEIDHAMQLIRHLNPSPIANYDTGSAYVVPDIMMHVDEDRTIHLEYMNLGDCIYICDIYEQQSEDKELNKYIQTKRREATMVLDCVQRRFDTLHRIMNYLSQYQSAYILDQKELEVLTMEDVATALSLHISTVSRAISNKYIDFDGMIIPVKKLFCKRVNKDMSLDRVQKRMLECIEDEDKKKPYSDMQLCDMLNKEGYDISRRTIAKYRTLLHIPTASKRKVQ